MNLMTLRSSPLQGSTLLDPIDGVVLQSDDAIGKTKFQTPISGGLGVSYYLTDRWTLSSGVVYTFLRSKGKDYDAAGNPVEWKQNLHFLGVPLSASYTIAEWKRINFYVSAGGMGEWNVAGKIKRTAKVEGLNAINNDFVRMKETLWSVNSRAGAVYPLWKFINVYAEAGASYYFDNHSNIETIRSNKPFNISLQAGIRFGF
jgi:outer membrane protein W